jgi:hypothetical protein
MRTIKPQEKKAMQKKLDSLSSKEEAKRFINSLSENELKLYAKFLDTPLYNSCFKITVLSDNSERDTTLDEIQKDILETLFG